MTTQCSVRVTKPNVRKKKKLHQAHTYLHNEKYLKSAQDIKAIKSIFIEFKYVYKLAKI